MRFRSAGLLVLLVLAAYAGETGVTNRAEPAAPGFGNRKAVRLAPGPAAREMPQARLVPLPPDSGWTLLDSMSLRRMIPAGERLAVKFDSATESLRDTLLPDFLTSLAHEAVRLAPTWLQDDLSDNFRRLSRALQDVYAGLIINCPDKRYYDELCFQTAHLSPSAFTNLPAQLLLDNVQSAYQIARELHYVEILDYGDPLQGGDYYSTTRYRAIVGGDTTWVEIPRDIYYWWIIMPKGTDEPPTYLYDKFWREYLYSQSDSGYPLLREKLANTRVLWNGEQSWWAGNGTPFYDSLPAVAVVGRWVSYTIPFSAGPVRPIQPIEIARYHHGNCGECQDLLWAAARTALIPCGGVCDINEDHVWCEIWWQGGFWPWQVDLGGGPVNIKNPGCAYDRKYGGSKECSGIWDWRNDGLQRSAIGTYSDVCTLSVTVRDSTGRPLDGAIVKISSEDWYGGMADCFYGVTDRFGLFTTTLGDWQNYYLQIMSPLGTHQAGRIIDSADCVPGTHFGYDCSLGQPMDSLAVLPDSGTALDRYRLDVSYRVDHETYYGYDCYNSNGSNIYALVRTPGALDFFVVDQSAFGRYLSGQPFPAFDNDENLSGATHSLVLPRSGDFYAVLSNQEQANLTAFADITVKLYRRSLGISDQAAARQDVRASLVPNPFRRRVEIRLGPNRPAGCQILILDRNGRRIRTVTPEPEAAWDGRDETGRKVPAGVYFCRIRADGRDETNPVVFLGQE